jgi:sigma-B regulation protein RsbU (phosphoserine phosphatase)
MAQVRTLSFTGVLIGIAGIMLLALVVVLIARSITAPLHLLAGATAAIAHGDFDVELPAVRSQDEVGTLSRAFLQMKTSLREHIKKLTETTAAKERIESELTIAHDIQMGLLPKIFPPFPDRSEIDIFATMAPAKEVGGDFYDFFFVDHTHLCFVIADVSGKGVPAALFMAMSMALFKATARYGLPPDQILSRVNNELARENDSCMFVTSFLGILDTETGELTYANGGHNPPLHLRRDGVARLPASGSLMVGAMEDAPYRADRLLLQPGDSLFLHTDGVNEAMNANQEIFSDERLQCTLSDLNGRPVKEVVYRVMADIRSFTGDAPQSDDITMMMIQYCGHAGIQGG